MPEVNPALFDPLTRIENARPRVSGIMSTAPTPPEDCNVVWLFSDLNEVDHNRIKSSAAYIHRQISDLIALELLLVD
jgi:hypothetical protein